MGDQAMTKQRIEVITMWFNEEFLAPFFLSHYRFADRINIILDADTNDNTLAIVSKCPNVHVELFKFPDMMDDMIKVGRINQCYAGLDCDWVICVDADEFIFPLPDVTWTRKFLSEVKEGNVVKAAMWNVYRHHSDENLDPAMEPVVMQRRHGDPNMGKAENAPYVKPIVCRPKAHDGWSVGNHHIKPNTSTKLAGEWLAGAHWANADPCFCIERRLKGRRDRQSKNNLSNRMTFQHQWIAEQDVLRLCQAHANDPQLF